MVDKNRVKQGVRHAMELLRRPAPVDLPPVIIPPMVMKAALECDDALVRKFAEERCVVPDLLAHGVSISRNGQRVDPMEFYQDGSDG